MTDRRIPDTWKADLLARTDLAQLIDRDVKLKRNGREFQGLCPFHREKSPSFTVVPSKGFYHCFGCGAHGDAIDFLVEHRGMRWMEAIEDLAARAGLDVPGQDAPARRSHRPAPAPIVANLTPEAAAAEDKRARAKAFEVWRAGQPVAGSPVEVYLGGRGIRPETVGRLQALRFHPALPYWWTPPRDRSAPVPRPQKLGEWPAMIAAITGPDGRFQALHQTWLADGGRGKRVIVAPNGEALKVKKVKGPAGGGAIRLVPLPEGAVALGGAEGIETAASVIQALGADGMAVWSLYSLGNLAGGGFGQGAPHPLRRGLRLPSVAPDPARPGFLPPDGVARFTWFADGDGKDPPAAEAIIRRGAVRYAQTGVALAVAKAPAGRDWNDVLTEGVA